jgi:5-methylcytosine-specific restriction endonuclease McrA
MTKPRLEFEAKEVIYELYRRVSKEEREFVTAAEFTRSNIWIRLRYDALEAKEYICKSCQNDGTDRGGMNVDHKRNRRDYPEVALYYSNLQLLCGLCNQGKGNRYNTDWEKRRPGREPEPPYTPPDDVRAQLKIIAPGWDHDKLLSEYRRFCRKKPDPVIHSPDNAFLGWVLKVTKGLPPPPTPNPPRVRRRARSRTAMSMARIMGRRRPFGGRKRKVILPED